MAKPIAHVRPLVLAHSPHIGRLIDAIEKDPHFEVKADPDEQGSFTVVLKENWHKAVFTKETLYRLRESEISH